MNVVELSKSSRAKCKQCKGAIDKAIPRYGEEYEFRAGGEVRTGMGWYHFECALQTRPDNIANAEIKDEIPENYLKQIEELKQKVNRSAFSVMGISELEEDGKQVNCKAVVLRVMKPLQSIDLNGNDAESQTIYVEDEGIKRKVLLWHKHLNTDVDKGDKIVVLKGITDVGSDDKIQVNVVEDSELYINPSEDELEQNVPSVEIFKSESWERPKGKFCVFENAKTGRANCSFCEEKIEKGELKLIKPVWAENEKTKQTYPGNRSFHLRCVEKDEHGAEVLLEAVSRLDPELIELNLERLTLYKGEIADNKAKEQLMQILD